MPCPSNYVRAAFLLAASSLVSSAPIPHQTSFTTLHSERLPTESTSLLKNGLFSRSTSPSDSRSYSPRESLVTDAPDVRTLPHTVKTFEIENVLMIEKDRTLQWYGIGKLFFDKATGSLTLSKLGPEEAEELTPFDLKDCTFADIPVGD
jgi:hypothetical protein